MGDLGDQQNTDLNLGVLKKITSSYTLNVSGLSASDALTLKAPAKIATLSLSISDTVDNISKNFTALQTAAKAKSIAGIAITPASAGTPKPSLTITTDQLKASPELLATIKGDYDLTITGVAAADAVTVAGNADKVLKASGSQSTQSKITISDTAANLVKSIAALETAATAGRLTSITVSDSKALVLTEAQIKADSHFLATQFTSNTAVEATAVVAADVTTVQSLVNANSKLTLTKESVADTAANIQSNLDNLETAVKATIASSSSSAYTIANIGITDKGNITVTNSKLVNNIDALKVLTGKYTLNVTDIGVNDALALKAPSKDATLAISAKDTAANIATNWDKLQVAVKAKTITAITVTDSASSLLNMTAAQLKADADALKLVTGDYKLAVTGVAAADVAKTLTTKNIYSVEVKDTAANILKNLTSIQTAVTAAKIQNVVITDAANPSLSISDIFALITTLPNVTLATGVKFNVKDTANMIIAHARDDIGDVLKNAGTVTVTDKTPPNLTLADAITLKGIANIDKTTKYNVTDGGAAIATQAAISGENILSGAVSVSINKNFTINDAKAVTGIKTLAKGTVYSITDTANNVLAQSAVAGDKILSTANTVTVVDTSANIIAKLDQLEVLAKAGKIADIKFTDTPSGALNITNDQLVKDADAIGKIVSQRTLPTLMVTKPATPAPISSPTPTPTPNPTVVPAPTMNGTSIPSQTNNNKPVFSGTAAANSTITLYNNSTSVLTTVQSDAGGNWSYTPTSAFDDGSYSITAKTSNADGIQSAASPAIIFTIDTIAPSAPLINGPYGSSTILQPTITGSAELNSTVQIFVNGSMIGTTTSNASGIWSYIPQNSLSTGTNSITAKSVDGAGNVSPASETKTLMINSPTVPPISGAISSWSPATIVAGQSGQSHYVRPGAAGWGGDQLWASESADSSSFNSSVANQYTVSLTPQTKLGNFDLSNAGKDIATAWTKLGGTNSVPVLFTQSGTGQPIAGGVMWVDLGSASGKSYTLKYQNLNLTPSNSTVTATSFSPISVSTTSNVKDVLTGMDIGANWGWGNTSTGFSYAWETPVSGASANSLGTKSIKIAFFDTQGNQLGTTKSFDNLSANTRWDFGTDAVGNYDLLQMNGTSLSVSKFNTDGSLNTSAINSNAFFSANIDASTYGADNWNYTGKQSDGSFSSMQTAISGMRNGKSVIDFYKTDTKTLSLINSTSITLNGTSAIGRIQTVRLPDNNSTVWAYQDGNILHLTALDASGSIFQDYQQTLANGANFDRVRSLSDGRFEVEWREPGSSANSNVIKAQIFDTRISAQTLNGSTTNPSILAGTSLGDTLTVKSANSIVEGGAGADTLTATNTALNATLSYEHSTSAVNVNLATNTVSGGDAQGDIISGFSNLKGSQFNDNLTGNANNNIFIGGAGNDTIVGGGGVDTAIYSGSLSDYTITLNSNGSITIADNRKGSPDGIDTLTGVVALKFADQTIAAPTGNLFLGVDPTKSFINGFRSWSGNLGGATTLTLGSQGIKAGDNISLTRVGAFDIGGAQSGFMIAVFLDNNNNPISLTDYSDTGPYPNDWPVNPPPFVIKDDGQLFPESGVSSIIKVPVGATKIAFMAKDLSNSDNSNVNNSYGVNIILQ